MKYLYYILNNLLPGTNTVPNIYSTRDVDVKQLLSEGPFNFKNSLNHKNGDVKTSLMSQYLFV